MAEERKLMLHVLRAELEGLREFREGDDDGHRW